MEAAVRAAHQVRPMLHAGSVPVTLLPIELFENADGNDYIRRYHKKPLMKDWVVVEKIVFNDPSAESGDNIPWPSDLDYYIDEQIKYLCEHTTISEIFVLKNELCEVGGMLVDTQLQITRPHDAAVRDLAEQRPAATSWCL